MLLLHLHLTSWKPAGFVRHCAAVVWTAGMIFGHNEIKDGGYFSVLTTFFSLSGWWVKRFSDSPQKFWRYQTRPSVSVPAFSSIPFSSKDRCNSMLMDRDFPILHSSFHRKQVFYAQKCEPLAFITRQPHYQDIHNYLTEHAFHLAVLLSVSFTVHTNSPPSARQGLFFLCVIWKSTSGTCPACRWCYSIRVWSHHWQHSVFQGDERGWWS